MWPAEIVRLARVSVAVSAKSGAGALWRDFVVNKSSKSRLTTSTLLAGLAGFTVPALAGAVLSLSPTDAAAQTVQTVPPNSNTSTASSDDQSSDDEVVVTGTIFRNNANSVSPLTVVDQANMEARGINTVQDAIQRLSSSGGPALTNSFTAVGAFAGGASGASLRALSTNSTLVLFDGLRASYYPLADDGARNFVDLNTIPDDIVERVEVLRDGASSTYGADAIAGVINIITKREFNGVAVRAEGGLTQDGIAAENRVSLTAGWGNLAEDGINAYISAYRYHQDGVYARDLRAPYNSADVSNICGDNFGPTVCLSNGIINSGAGISTGFGGNFFVRRGTHNASGTFTFAPGARYQYLDPTCQGVGTVRNLTVAQQGTTLPTSLCTYDRRALYSEIMPEVDRWGVSGRASFELPNDVRGYVEGNFLQSEVSFTGQPATFRGTANTGIYHGSFSTSQVSTNPGIDPGSFILYLPNWVCPDRTDCATDPLRALNPNNPYASAVVPPGGNDAAIYGTDVQRVTSNDSRNRSYRIAGGLSGSFENGWDWDVAATAMHTDLRLTTNGYVYIQHLLDVIADGTYNFINPAANSQAIRDYVMPENRNDDSSDEVELQGTLSMPLFELAGGPMQFAIGGSWRYEAVDAPSANSDFNGATQRYFTLNAFGAVGDRTVRSGFFELDAPVLENLDINISGRYDDYSSGQSAFSPKIGARWRPFDFLTLRGSYSEGFRIPAFGEANSLPTTGFISVQPGMFTDAYLSQYGCTVATFNACPAYITGASLGLTTLGTPGLQPEESRSYTAGFIVEPFQNFTVSVDYWNIEKTNAITGSDYTPAITSYYAGLPDPAGLTTIPGAADPNTPGATPLLGFIQFGYVNANTINASGWDFEVTYNRDITDNIRWNSNLDVSYIARLSTTFPDPDGAGPATGSTQRYDGTLGNFNLTAGSGTPKWHGSWVNTLSVGMFDFTGTVNWTSGYDLSAMDSGSPGYKDCSFDSGVQACRVEDALSYDLGTQAHLNDNVTLYLNVLNITDEMPPLDTVTYGAFLYNPVQAGDMVLGRNFRAGVRLNF